MKNFRFFTRPLHFAVEADKTLTIYCFQPAPGYCACVLIPS